jgi:O-Antigen ligase
MASSRTTPPTAKPNIERDLALTAAFAIGHAFLALVMRQYPMLGVVHAFACVGIGMYVAARRPLAEVAIVIGYICAAEVLWRMTRVPIFWEFSKYAVIVIGFIGVLRTRAHNNRGLALGYFGLLLPSSILTVFALDLGGAREQISFNLAGPMTLAVCILLFSNMPLDGAAIRRTLLWQLGPIIGIAALAYQGISRAESIQFVMDSNSILSGGYGPNQVSATLGIGVLGCVLLLLTRKEPTHVRIVLMAVVLVLGAQAALTFSRGGLAMAGAATVAAASYLLRDRRARATLLVLSGLVYIAATVYVVPYLEVFTEGKLGERFATLDPTGRTELLGFDLQIFADNPVLGVGPGIATPMRAEMGHFGAAHTEYTRMLAEHGMLGAISLVLLVIVFVRTVMQSRTVLARAFVTAFIVWTVLFLGVNGVRLALPGYTLGLACAISYSSRLRGFAV